MTKKAKEEDINHIREDIHSLKENIVSLTQHLGEEGRGRAASLRESVTENIEGLKTTGRTQVKRAEAGVKKHPFQSMAFAFGAGLLLSALMRKK